MSEGETIIRLEEVSVRFLLFKEKSLNFKEYLVKLFKRSLKYDELWALDDVTLSVKRGEFVGLIGKNGSGKTTLLKVISGIITPTSGSVYAKGRIVPLMELGAGFDPELTGRENIYLNGSIMGLSKKDIDKKVDKIIEFSELEEFIDVPVKNYSSGMFVRLAFSMAIDVEPDILLVDEVLAVGDASFQKKCFKKMDEFMEKGITMIFVSHNMEDVIKLCKRTIWLDSGKVIMDGPSQEVVEKYLTTMGKKDVSQPGTSHRI